MISYESSYSILIGHRIRNERIALGMTQSEFAKLLGIASASSETPVASSATASSGVGSSKYNHLLFRS